MWEDDIKIGPKNSMYADVDWIFTKGFSRNIL
jgi:hypothetical protein